MHEFSTHFEQPNSQIRNTLDMFVNKMEVENLNLKFKSANVFKNVKAQILREIEHLLRF